MKINSDLIDQIVLPRRDSRKGENGKVLVIGGSKLFHVAPFWAAAAASKACDIVHFSSPYLLNNELMERRAKGVFWSGIVVPWSDVEHYIHEDDAILIGPGMERGDETKGIVNTLLQKYPNKKWVVDGGALQEVLPSLLTNSMIATPNHKEWEILIGKGGVREGVVVLKKGEVDEIVMGEKQYWVEGGSVAMTKGGTGDILSGIVAGLYAKSPALASCYVASLTNKKAGERLASSRGVFFDANDLLGVVGEELKNIITIL